MLDVPGIPHEMLRMRARFQLAALAVLGVVFLALGVLGAWAPSAAEAVAAVHDEPAAVERAREAYDRGDYMNAHNALLSAALRGNAEAQELLGVMYALGDSVYPGVFGNSQAASIWLNRAALNGRPTARYLKCAISRRGNNPAPAAYCFDRIAASGGSG
jgi:TPR repeat protein